MIGRIALAALLASPAVAMAQAMSPDMPGMDMSQSAAKPSAPGAGQPQPAGDAPPPAPPTDHYADQAFGAAAMAGSRAMFQQDNGGMAFSQVLVNLAELQFGAGRPGYRWDGEGWLGGDIDRLAVKSEGDGASASGLEAGEVQALYSRAAGPYFDLQAGVRETFGRVPSRTYATLGFEGLAPYWLQVEGALFLSAQGDVQGRLEGYYDQRITQRLVLQPRVELNLAARDAPQERIAAGLSEAELGLRLRYEIAREFAPYIGVSWDRKALPAAALAQISSPGQALSSTTFVAGVRTWF